MKKIRVSWPKDKTRVTGHSHPGCCTQDGGCGKKHGK